MRILVSIAFSVAAFGQQRTGEAVVRGSELKFDVVSVKPQKWTGQGSVGVFVRGDTLDAEHASLKGLVLFAYNLRDVQLSGGPAWAEVTGLLADSELFQVIAKVSSDPPPPLDEFRKMLQPVLADRFKLQIHHTQKPLPVHNLVVAKGGPKLNNLKPGDPASNPHFATSSRGRFGLRIVATNMTIQRLIERQLEIYAGRPTFDRTGLTAPYDFTLEFVSEQAPLGEEDPTLPRLLTAIQEQLGLKLEPATAPFDTIVIDHAERPDEN
ncbi:MAG TPA: TIGR03435 family protein [Bryobacteraceae bacterium]